MKPKRILAFMLTLVMILSILPTNILTLQAQAATKMSGSGTADDPYMITEASQLSSLYSSTAATYYKLANDITLTSDELDSSSGVIREFRGVLDGNGHKISGLELKCNYYNGSQNCKGGLIGRLSGTIKNIIIDSPKVYSVYKVSYSGVTIGEWNIERGLIADSSSSSGTIDNVQIKDLKADMTCSTAQGDRLKDPSLRKVSLMVYKNYGKMMNSSITADVKFYSIYDWAGIAYENHGTIANVQANITYDCTQWYDSTPGMGRITAGVFTNYTGGTSNGTMYNVWVDADFKMSAEGHLQGMAFASKDGMSSVLCSNNSGKIEKCYYNGTTDGNIFSQNAVDQGVYKTDDAATTNITKKSFDEVTYNTNSTANTLGISGLVEYGAASKLKLVFLVDTLQKASNETYDKTPKIVRYVVDSDTFTLPNYIDNMYYYDSFKLSGGQTKKPGDVITLTGDMTITADDRYRIEPAFDSTCMIPQLQNLPDVWNEWEYYRTMPTGTSLVAPTLDELEDAGVKRYIAKVNDDGTISADAWVESYNKKLNPGEKFCVKYEIPKNNGRFRSGTYKLYETSYDTSTEITTVTKPTYDSGKIELNSTNYKKYIKFTEPSKIYACESPHSSWPSVSPVDEALYPENLTLQYRYRGASRPTVPGLTYQGTYYCALKVEEDDNFKEAEVSMGDVYVRLQPIQLTYEDINAKHNTEFTITANAKAYTDETNVLNPIGGKCMKISSFTVDGAERDDYEQEQTIENGEAAFTFSGLPAGSVCTFELSYEPQIYSEWSQWKSDKLQTYDAKTVSGTFTVGKGDGSISIETDKTKYSYGDDVMIYITAPQANDENDLIIKDEANDSANITFVKKDENNRYVYKYESPSVGTLNIKAKATANDYYNEATCSKDIIVNKQAVTFAVSDTKHIYKADTKREISITPSALSANDYTVKYYLVDENTNTLYKTTPEQNAISAGKYLYVISFADAQINYEIKNEYTVSDTTLPDVDSYDNVGFMYITSGAETAQKPIYFEDGTVNLKVGGTFENELTNENGTTPEIKSSNESVATATFADGKVTVTAIGKGTATITATSTKDNTTPVYASFTVNVGLATKTLTAENFNIVATSKTYDETDSVTLTATLKDGVAYEGDNLKFDITGKFENADAGEGKKVSYEITDITGTGAENYVLDGGKISVSAENSTVKANINKAVVTIICSETTTRTFDGNAQTVDVSAMANGKVFDKSNYDIKYNGGEAPSAVGSYPVTIELKAEAAKNYEVTQPSAKLVIKSATQDVFSIEGVPEVVYYGDTFELSNSGATGDVTYKADESGVLKITGTTAVANKTGKVTITATSTKGGYNDRVATKTIEVKKRILTPTATATGKTYDGTNTVAVSITLDNTVNSDKISTNTTTGTMANADAGNGKIVYVSGIELTGDKKNYYTLSTTSLQTTVDIEKAEITGFTVSANDKKYDGNTNATATVTEIDGVIEADKGQVEIVGSAKFDGKDNGNRTVTFTATGLSGAKSQNYKFKDNDAKTATDTAKIEPLEVDFVIGQTTFVYDGKDKEISVSASDENGKIFKDYSVEYKKDGNSVTPNEVGTYTATITLDDTTNYYTEQGNVDVVISEATQDSLVIVGLPGTIQYGDGFDLEAIGGEDGGSYEWTTSDDSNITISDKTSSKPTVTINGAVGKKVEISVTKKVDNYEPITAKVVFVPTAKTVTFDISNLEQTYGTVTDVTVTPSETGAAYDVTYNGSDKLPTNAGTYTVKVTATENYTGVQTATLTVKKATATGTITGVENSYTYGTTVVATDVSVENLKAGTSAKITYAGTGIYVPQESAPTKVGNYTAIAEITGDNYETLTVTKDFVIEKKELTVRAKDDEREYGDANPIFKLVYDGFVNGEDKNVLLSEPIATVNANASSPVTDDNTKYYITVSGGNAENYKFKYDNTGELVIKPTGNGTLYITGSSNTVRVDDVFMLYAFYGNNKVNVTWSLKDGSPSDVIELDTATGRVTAKKYGTVTIVAAADKNYGGKTAEFTLNVKQTGITLVPTGLVKTYTGGRQDISFANNADFIPEIGKNVTVEYTLISDPTVKEPVRVGTYSVVYTINDGSYTGGGNTTMYINKATVTAKVKDDTKVYGDEYTGYDIEITNDGGITNETALAEVIANIKSATSFASDGAAKTAVVKEGGYEMIPTLSVTETDNVKFTVDKGTLTVNKAPLTIKVKDVSREYGAENPALEAEYTGFKNEETKEILSGELILAYDESINAETAVGTYEDKTTANGVTADNYEIAFEQGDVEITKIAVNASAGTSRASYLTVKFDKAVEDVTFTVKNGETPVEVTSVTASSDNKTYTLNGTFTVGTEYTVEIAYDNATQDISNKTLKITPTKQSSGGGGGGGSSATTSYTVTFETNGGSKVDSVKVTKNNTVTEPTAPTKDGFEFDGWYSDKKLTTAYDFDTKVTKAITLYAKWVEKKVDDNKDNNNNPTPSEWKNPFTDVTKTDWFFDNVRYANENGLMSGTTDTTFAPNDNLTRAMLVTVLYRAEGEPAVNKSIPFADVKADMYYANAVIWAEQNGIVKGVSETEFAPDENITREQIATIIYRYAEYKGIAPTGAWAIKLDYADVADISDYAVEGVMYCTMKNIMQGKDNNMFAPKDFATRAEIAAILNRFIEGNK